MNQTTAAALVWTPRLIAIAILCALAASSIDVFSPGPLGPPLWGVEDLAGLTAKLLPAFAMLLALMISWSHQSVGGALIVAGSLIPFLRMTELAGAETLLGLALLIAGALFLMGGEHRRAAEARVSRRLAKLRGARSASS
jgi:hypothetical protein